MSFIKDRMAETATKLMSLFNSYRDPQEFRVQKRKRKRDWDWDRGRGRDRGRDRDRDRDQEDGLVLKYAGPARRVSNMRLKRV